MQNLFLIAVTLLIANFPLLYLVQILINPLFHLELKAFQLFDYSTSQVFLFLFTLLNFTESTSLINS